MVVVVKVWVMVEAATESVVLVAVLLVVVVSVVVLAVS